MNCTPTVSITNRHKHIGQQYHWEQYIGPFFNKNCNSSIGIGFKVVIFAFVLLLLVIKILIIVIYLGVMTE